MPKESNDKVKDLDEKIKQLQAQKQQLLNKVKEEERRKRTKRLIEVGAIMDSVGMLSVKQAMAFKNALTSDKKDWFDKLMKESAEAENSTSQQASPTNTPGGTGDNTNE
mgnify:CR=1 FL=1